jgi:hypothetical protein
MKTLSLLIGITIVTLIIISQIPLWLMSTVLGVFLFSWVPQIIKSSRTFQQGSRSAVSILSCGISILSCIPAIIYGIATNRSIIVLTATLSFLLLSIIIILELGAKRKVRPVV